MQFRVNGLEFANWDGARLRCGIETQRSASASTVRDAKYVANELRRLRSSEAADRNNALFLRNPEAWLESCIRRRIAEVDAGLLTAPVHGQVPAVLTGQRGVIDLLACDFAGRLAVIEVKVAEDLHLPLQGLDYWIRVKWHLDRGEFSGRGFFPGITLQATAPRMLLVSPVLNIHPTTEIVLRYFSPQIEVEQIGLAMDWVRDLKVVFRRRAGTRAHD